MSRTEKLAVFTACVMGLSLTAGLVDMMVSESSAISWRASAAGQQAMDQPWQTFNQDYQAIQQQEYTPPQPQDSAIFSCVEVGKKWRIVDGNTAGPISAPLFTTAKSCMKQVNDWSKS